MSTKFENVPVDCLKIDHSYQRGQISHKKVARMAAAWSWRACGTLTVAQRNDGSMVVVDGQHRLLAATAAKIKSLPCMVHTANTLKDEASTFLEINTGRTPVNALCKWRAECAIGREPYASFNEWLASIGLHVAGGGQSADAIQFAGVLMNSLKTSPDAAKRAIVATRQIHAGSPMVNDVFRACFWLELQGVDMARHVARILRRGGSEVVVRKLRAARAITGSAGDLTNGLALLRFINEGLHNKVEVASGEDTP